jgi:Circularly permutated YpsA SLOG family
MTNDEIRMTKPECRNASHSSFVIRYSFVICVSSFDIPPDGPEVMTELAAFRIVSGGQTGVDRAALDVAIAHGIPCGGWCPRGRLAEDKPIPVHYPLEETESAKYAVRTRLNVRDSDGTLVLVFGEPAGGTSLTVDFAAELHRPCLVVDLLDPPETATVAEWIAANRISTLNVAGPRESTAPGIYSAALRFLAGVFSRVVRAGDG